MTRRCSPSTYIFRCVFLFAYSLAALGTPCVELAERAKTTGILKGEGAEEASVEIETDLTDNVLQLLDTPDGTVGPLFFYVKGRYPDFLLGKMKAEGLTKPEDVQWDTLNLIEKRKLLVFLSRQGQQAFYKDRIFHGIKVRDVVSMKFARSTTFLGHNYEPGVHQVDVSKAFRKVEYRSPNDIQDATGLELHFREAQNPGEMSVDARNFQRATDIPVTHQHVHEVATLPLGELRADPLAVPFELADHFRRANLAAEMYFLVAERGTIATVSDPNLRATFFDNLSVSRLNMVHQYFYDEALGRRPLLGDRVKMGWVGFRGRDKYDGTDLYGYEFRSIDESSNLTQLGRIMNGCHEYKRDFATGKGRTTFKKWWAAEMNGNIKDHSQAAAALERLWYTREFSKLANEASPKIKAELTPDLLAVFATGAVDHFQTQDKQVKMLVYNWAKDPALHGFPELQARVEAAQIDGLRSLRKYPKDGAPIVYDFLLNSGLFKHFMTTIASPT